MLISERAIDARYRAIERIERVRLLGEIALTDRESWAFRELVRDLNALETDPREKVPEVIALLMVATARKWSDGADVWTAIKKELSSPRDHFPMDREPLGELFVEVLRTYNLPAFDHLVEAGASKYRVRILAHALIPEPLMPSFLGGVVGPALEKGWTATDIQSSRVDLGANRVTIERFLMHGGETATDLLGRAIDFAESCRMGRADSGAGLPEHLRTGIQQWAAGTAAAHRRIDVPQPRRPQPGLRLDYGTLDVVVDLPYVDGEDNLSWEVSYEPGQRTFQSPASVPKWAREGTHHVLAIEEPFVSLRVRLLDGHGRERDSWTLPALTARQPVLFFHAQTLRAQRTDEYLDGQRWFVVRPGEARLRDSLINCSAWAMGARER